MSCCRLAVAFCACLAKSNLLEIGSDSSRCSEDGEVLLLQTSLKVSSEEKPWDFSAEGNISLPSAVNSSEARTPKAPDQAEMHRGRVPPLNSSEARSLLADSQEASATGLLVMNRTSSVRTVVLLVAAVMIMIPVGIVCIMEAKWTQQTTSDNHGSSKHQADTESAQPPERNLQVKRYVRIQEPDAAVPFLPPTSPTDQPVQYINPPAICPSLVLPMHEARFMISMRRIRAAMQGQLGPIEILGLSGHKLLHGVLEDVEGIGTRLTVAQVSRDQDPRAIIVTGSSGHRHEVHGANGQTYGTLDFFGARVLLMQGSNPVMVFDAGDPNALHFIASGMDSRVLASAGLHANELNEEDEVWRLQVRPSVDSILTMICMLAIIMLPRQRVHVAAIPSSQGVSSQGSWRSPYSSWQ